MGRPINSKFMGKDKNNAIIVTSAWFPGDSEPSKNICYIVRQKGTKLFIITDGINESLLKLVSTSDIKEGEAFLSNKDKNIFLEKIFNRTCVLNDKQFSWDFYGDKEIKIPNSIIDNNQNKINYLSIMRDEEINTLTFSGETLTFNGETLTFNKK